MLYRHSALAIAAAIVGSGCAGAVSLPRAAEAQVYDDAGPRPYGFHTQDDVDVDPGRGWADHRGAFDGGPRGPGDLPHHGLAATDGSDDLGAGSSADCRLRTGSSFVGRILNSDHRRARGNLRALDRFLT